jgi:hypothetical protein
MHTWLRHSPAAVAAVLLATSGIAPAAAQPRSGTQILIDFRPVTEDGKPVSDLKASEVTLRVGGRDREIKTFHMVSADRAAAPSAALPAPFATNAVAPSRGRDVLVIVDEDSIAPVHVGPIRESVAKLAAALTPADRVRLLSMRQGGVNEAFSPTDAERAKAAIDRISGHSTPTENANDLICRTGVGLQRLRNIFNGYAGQSVPTVVLISAGFGAPPEGGRARTSVRMGQTDVQGISGPCPQMQTADFEEVGLAAQSIHATAYVIEKVDATASRMSRDQLIVGVETLAGTLNAEIIRAAGASVADVQRIADETATYYLAGFEPEAREMTGMRERIEIKIARPGVRLQRARKDVFLLKPEGARGKTLSPNDLLRVPAVLRDLPLRAAAFASRADGNKVRLVVLFEPAAADVKLTAASVGLYDAKGKLTSWKADSNDLAKSPAMGGIIIAPGAYRMRVAAADSAGRTGTVDTDVQADLSNAGTLTLSTMLLGVSAADGGFQPRLQFTGADAGAFGYLEIYGVAKGTTPSVKFEIAPSADAPALAGHDVKLAQGPSDDVLIAYSGFSIADLPAGDVVLRAIVLVDGKEAGRAVRTLRKVN